MSLTRKIQAAVMVALLLTLVFAVQASAQAASPKIAVTSVEKPAGLIRPEIDNPQLTVNYKYTLDTPFHTAVGQVNQNLEVSFQFDCPPFVVITGAGSTTLAITPSPTESEFNGEAPFNVAIKRTAPGLEQIPCTLKAQTGAVGNLQAAPASAPYPFSVSADYYSLLQATIASQLKQSGPYKQVPFQIDITNFGNARTQVNFELANEPSGGKWDAIVPTQLILESPNTGLTPTQGTATLTVSTTYKNGWNNEQGSYGILIKSVAADAPDKPGNELSANFLVRVRGVYVPSIEPFLMVASILGSALVLRMRRAE